MNSREMQLDWYFWLLFGKILRLNGGRNDFVKPRFSFIYPKPGQREGDQHQDHEGDGEPRQGGVEQEPGQEEHSAPRHGPQYGEHIGQQQHNIQDDGDRQVEGGILKLKPIENFTVMVRKEGFTGIHNFARWGCHLRQKPNLGPFF